MKARYILQAFAVAGKGIWGGGEEAVVIGTSAVLLARPAMAAIALRLSILTALM
jgi:hypothetical protein